MNLNKALKLRKAHSHKYIRKEGKRYIYKEQKDIVHQFTTEEMAKKAGVYPTQLMRMKVGQTIKTNKGTYKKRAANDYRLIKEENKKQTNSVEFKKKLEKFGYSSIPRLITLQEVEEMSDKNSMELTRVKVGDVVETDIGTYEKVDPHTFKLVQTSENPEKNFRDKTTNLGRTMSPSGLD